MKNKTIYNYIKDIYKEESNSDNWKSEIIYSKWWLPLFRIKQCDEYNYDGFMKSSCMPEIFARFCANGDVE